MDELRLSSWRAIWMDNGIWMRSSESTCFPSSEVSVDSGEAAIMAEYRVCEGGRRVYVRGSAQFSHWYDAVRVW